ncbi:MAG: hypothetical protein WC346_15860 [Methanogenium sp.]|jgi:hypothetical protein
MVTDIQPLVVALTNKLQVTLVYQKKKTGEIVTHTGGIYEIGPHKKTGVYTLWLWDTSLNDHIRDFIVDNIQSFQVLEIPFVPNGLFPLKYNGEIVG